MKNNCIINTYFMELFMLQNTKWRRKIKLSFHQRIFLRPFELCKDYFKCQQVRPFVCVCLNVHVLGDLQKLNDKLPSRRMALIAVTDRNRKKSLTTILRPFSGWGYISIDLIIIKLWMILGCFRLILFF